MSDFAELGEVQQQIGQDLLWWKIVTVDVDANRHNARFVAAPGQDVPEDVKYHKTSKHPSSVMVLGVIAWFSNGLKCPPVFVESGVKINAQKYQELLDAEVSSLAETAVSREQLCVPTGICYRMVHLPTQPEQHILLETQMAHFWPPSSPDLNPLDYSIWAHLEAEVNATSHASLKSLKAAIKKAWKKMDAAYIVNNIMCRWIHWMNCGIWSLSSNTKYQKKSHSFAFVST